MTVWRSIAAAFALIGFLSACALPGLSPGPAKPPGEEVDGAPDGTLDVSLIRPVTPRPEPRSPYGNHSPYEVLGQTYHVRPSAAGYRERGIASWYGTKFHGRLTSSGEPYDMYQLTAAHRSLPLPTFAEVTHLENGRSIIVRINDRGPFHQDRIIDLSWAAAVKLGIDQAGTGPVEVRAISFAEPEVPVVRPASLPVLLQVGAFSERQRAEALAATLSESGVRPILIEPAHAARGRIWRVRVGPLNDLEQVFSATDRITALGFQRPQYVYP
ncbi:MAG: septal ring lytic transglycosylase RlpA family protein [Wenzhouxiangella sp.]|nr:septal ring lytic transglycosylase RlpA family protein [Wenzhouxiangella sp.]